MAVIPEAIIENYRQKTFRSEPGNRIHTIEEAIEFVNQRGFVFFWPIQGLVLPSLWVAAAGNRPVADQHDDPGHITWGWKDQLLGSKVWYYARVLHRKNTIISLKILPCFYALSPNYGDPDHDYLEQYYSGTLTIEAKQIYEALLREGPLDTLSLRKAARLSSPESTSRFNRALETLQTEFKVLPVGIAQAGAWRYAFIYEVVHRHFPNLIEQSRPIPEKQARFEILKCYFDSVGAASFVQIQRLFGWRKDELQRTLKELTDKGFISPDHLLEKRNEPLFVLASLIGTL